MGGTAEAAKFPLQSFYQGSFSYRFASRWTLDFSYASFSLYNDSTAAKSLTFSRNADHAIMVWKATRLGIRAQRYLFSPERRTNLLFGCGGGLMLWKYNDAAADTTLKTTGARNETTDFAASEIFLSVASRFEFPLRGRLFCRWEMELDYLTTAGAEFQTGVNSSRKRWLATFGVGITFAFGKNDRRREWRLSSRRLSETSPDTAFPSSARDSDGDGVPDKLDRCPQTPGGIRVDSRGCAVDSDADGVDDSRDDCPDTDPRARQKVDIFGCPVDSDFDGVPDYLDACPFNPIGALVDSSGCPYDGDKDGVPDGLDDCPNTLYGAEVDKYGCIDLSIFSKPLILNIDYAPGSFDVDPKTLKKLKKLAQILNFVPDIKLEINGYTDNIGKARANKLLSEKRARRIRDYLVTFDVAPERIKVFGRGETNFIAPNDTAEGRAKNRRVEIIFFR